MSYEKEYVRGLREVAACQTGISFVDPLTVSSERGSDLEEAHVSSSTVKFNPCESCVAGKEVCPYLTSMN